MSTQGFDHRRFKAQERAGFNRIAEHYDKGADLRADLQRALLDEAALQPGEHVLDLASGPGLLARDATLRVGERGQVVASDIAEAMLQVGLRRAAEDGLAGLLFAAADAEQLPFAEARFVTRSELDRLLATARFVPDNVALLLPLLDGRLRE